MLKKITFCLFSVALFFGSGNLFAQEAPQFSVSSPVGKIIEIPEGTKLNLRNAAELTDEELKAALEKSSCSTATGQEKDPFACYAFTGANCTGTFYQIPCGLYINAGQQVPPVVPGFLSFATGCTSTVVSTCADFSCGGYQFDTAVWGDNACFNSSVPLQAVGCF
jgi:hypothetical protein